MVIVNDPIYLAEPDVVTRSWALDPKSTIATTAAPCVPVSELSRVEAVGSGSSSSAGEKPRRGRDDGALRIPREAVLGYPETLYPEYRKKLNAETFIAQDRCQRYCCALGGARRSRSSAPGLTCITNGTDRPNFTPLGTPFIPAPPR